MGPGPQSGGECTTATFRFETRDPGAGFRQADGPTGHCRTARPSTAAARGDVHVSGRALNAVQRPLNALGSKTTPDRRWRRAGRRYP
jgi:hypothetical protein